MIRAYTAYTTEIDDVATAVREVMAQIPLEELGRHSVGIVTCYPEFADSGVLAALCDALPFDVAGCTTLGNAACRDFGHLGLALMVLTSNDAEFSVAVTAPLSDEQEAPLEAAYTAALSPMTVAPKLIFAFAPLIFHVGGEIYVDTLTRLSAGVPIFGTLPVDSSPDYHGSKVVYNGEVYPDSLAMLLVGGEVSPRFLVASVSEDKVLKQKAIITASEGNILKEVNGVSAVRYLEGLGLTRDGVIEGPSTLPFVVDFGDGTKPVVRAIYAQTPQGYAVCGGSMPEGATLSVGSLDYDDVIRTANGISDEILQAENAACALLFTCVSRNFALGVSTTDEMEAVGGKLCGKIPYHLAYSGGEICPLYGGGTFFNRFHNDTIIACIL